MDIPAFVSERFVVAIETPDDRRKVFQVLFGKKDGSLFVSFPYYKDAAGFLTLATLKAKTEYPTSISLLDGGKVTGHKVKYVHHPDGEVHFSQDRKILTTVRKASVPLSTAEGHIFTIQLQGLKDFERLRPNEINPVLTNKKTILNFRFEGTSPEAVKFVGHWYRKSALIERSVSFGTTPQFIVEKPDRSKAVGMLISDPFLHSNDHYYLLIICEAVPMLDRTNYSALAFMGGFDPKEIVFGHDRDTKFLTLSYPASDTYETLKKQLGSVDYIDPLEM